MLEYFRKLFRKPLGIVAISFGLIPFFGAKQQPYVFDFNTTINFIQPGLKWPVEKLLTPVEKQVLAQYGRPDMFRMLWSKDGSMKMRSVVELEWSRKNLKEIPPVTWVYTQRKEEVVFSGNSFHAQPLTEVMQIVIKNGDPENTRDIGNGVSQWTYYSTGKIYTIAGDRVVETKEFPAMGSFHK